MIEVRQKRKTEGSAGLIPNPVVVTGDYPERVGSRRKVRILGDASGAGINPFLIDSFQLVFEFDLCRVEETQSCVMKLKLLLTGRDRDILLHLNSLVAGKESFDDDWRWLNVARKLIWIDRDEALDGRKPQSAVRAFPGARLIALAAGRDTHPVFDAI